MLKRPIVRLCLTILAVVTLAAILGPMLLPAHYAHPSPDQFAPPSLKHPFGTDLNGRDLLFRVLQGARISLIVGLSGALISLCIGTTYGLVAGYVGGRTDALMMRVVEILYAVPRLIIILVLISVFDPAFKRWLGVAGLGSLIGYSKILILIVALGLIEWLTMARIVRGQVLVLKSLQFVAAAEALGQSRTRIIFRHLLPNLAGVVIIYLTLTIPAVILDESFLSFLGLGIQAPQASWGTLLSDGAQVINPIRSNWWLLVLPALVMSLTLLAFNFLGDALRDALDPRAKR